MKLPFLRKTSPVSIMLELVNDVQIAHVFQGGKCLCNAKPQANWDIIPVTEEQFLKFQLGNRNYTRCTFCREIAERRLSDRVVYSP